MSPGRWLNFSGLRSERRFKIGVDRENYGFLEHGQLAVR